MCPRGLGPRSWWYIPESGIYHQPKLTQPRACRARNLAGERRRQCRPAAQPGRVSCGNGEGGGRDGAPCQGRTAAAASRGAHLRKRGDSLPLLPTVPAAAAAETGPDDLATELNPHKTELNPHKAVPGGQPHRADQNGAFRAGRSAGRSAMATTRVPAHDVPAAGCARHRDPGQPPMGSPRLVQPVPGR